MDFPFELLINAIIAGVLLGGFYVAVTVGVSISFGMLDIVNIAHPGVHHPRLVSSPISSIRSSGSIRSWSAC